VATKNTLIGSFIMKELPKKLPADSEVEVTFQYNLDGIVQISAYVPRGGSRKELTVDVHRLRALPEGGRSEEREKGGSGAAGRRTERLLRMARRKTGSVRDSPALEELKGAIAALEQAVRDGGSETEVLFEKLARLVGKL
jgi:molecular chaperone DnaK